MSVSKRCFRASLQNFELKRMKHQKHKDVAAQTDPLERVTDLSEVTKFIKKQLEKDDTNWEEIEKCMAATYDYRRRFILEQAPIVKTVKEIYPGLFYFEQIKKEFDRIKNNQGIYETFLSSLEHFERKIWQFAYPGSLTDLVERKLKECKCSATKTKTQQHYIKTAGALLALPFLFGITPKKLIIFDVEKHFEDVEEYVIIGSKSSFENCLDRDAHFIVFAEKTRLCETKDLRAAFFAYFAGHYIFNIQYHEDCAEMIGVMEKLFLKIEPDMDDFTEKMKDIQMLLVGSDSP